MIRWAGCQRVQNTNYLKRVWELIYPWLIYEGITLLVTYVFALVNLFSEFGLSASSIHMQEMLDRVTDLINRYYLPLALVICLLTIPVLLFFMIRDRKREVREGFEMELWEKPGLLSSGLCALCGISACVVLNHVFIYSGVYSLLEDGFTETAQVLYPGNIWLELLAVGLLTPVVEELIFRGLIYRRLRWIMNVRPAIILSSLLFAFIHGNWLQLFYSLSLGLLLAYSYERTHRLAAPICIHGGANVAAVLLTEWNAISVIYEEGKEGAFLLVTGAMMLVFVLAFYTFYVRIRPARIEREKTGAEESFAYREE